MVARPKHTPVGDELSPETAILAAAKALDAASFFATQREDAELLLNIAAVWVTVATSLAEPEDEELEEEEPDRFSVGFGGS